MKIQKNTSFSLLRDIIFSQAWVTKSTEQMPILLYHNISNMSDALRWNNGRQCMHKNKFFELNIHFGLFGKPEPLGN